MAALLANFRNTMIVSFVLALVMIYAYATASGYGFDDVRTWQAVLRWVHIFFGILWIGLLYYFNFVQARKMPEIPAELKPGISKFIAPEALFWFRWGAMGTVVAGLILAWLNNYLVQALTLGAVENFANPKNTLMGIGMWLALIMFFNVWGVIWPKQKIALGLVEADADAKAKAALIAGQFSRINTLLSLPMLVAMGMTQTLFGS
jgi:uncharacterized membrane protein